MPRDHELYPIQEPDGQGPDGRIATAVDFPLANTLLDLISDLFAAGLQLQVVLKDVDGDTEPARRVRAVILRIDATIAALRHASRAESGAADARHVERTELLRMLTTSLPHVAQAEGMLAERHQIPIADAAEAMATYARQHGTHLPDLARGVIDGTVDLSERPD
jgi:ANTAR domain-containing protein